MLPRILRPHAGLTSFGFFLLACCLAPYLLDVAICEEFSSVPLHQPAWVDGEEVDPSEATGTSIVHGDHLPTTVESRSQEVNGRTVVKTLPLRLSANLIVISLNSRPPPPLAFA
ncbi:MAG TPA: hypothetical protein VIU63_10570 [Nitrospira sp.]